jgi:hypothetical protein
MLTSSLAKAKGHDVRLHTAAGIFEGKLTDLDSGIDLVVLDAGDQIHVSLEAIVRLRQWVRGR